MSARINIEKLQRESRNRHIKKEMPITIRRKKANAATIIQMKQIEIIENKVIDWTKVARFASK